ncbi:uncharacterized protein F4822DRAFT_409176 [Hypoxylon trugodes]|uniref:uncharacterized protein n=1 Tax=Hypoxylon trugodes TaxID=326681 RepID=UPI002199AE67|nr:uncharacterized protein F4822DRAFT_409176 [Hypoxylon trugodes]KAI1386184.1 hypothetical protein F4822DRAFT_409176 [Hypoxylon trugodes]
MAQASSITRGPIPSGFQAAVQNGTLTPADLDEIRQYQRIIGFRDTIVSGKHTRIKVAKPTMVTPQHSTSIAAERVAQQSSSTQLSRNPSHNLNSYQVDNMHSYKANSQQPAVTVASTGSTTAIPGVPRPLNSARTDFYPALHGKPGKAEPLSKRQKLEQDLKEQLEQRKASQLPPEQMLDLDLSDILAKALTLVQATAPLSTAGTPNAGSVADSSDSFDNNTFYSSPHETPDTRASPRVQNISRQDVQMQDATTSAPRQPTYLPQQPQSPLPIQSAASVYQTRLNRSALSMQVASSSQQQPSTGGLATSVQNHTTHTTTRTRREGGLITQSHQARRIDAQVISSDSGAASRSDNSGNTDSDQPADHSRIQSHHQLLPAARFRPRESPLIRAHDLSPFAPQPTHVSPLTTDQRPPIPEPELSILPGAPAQVTALRQEHGPVTSPESSPQGDKGGKRKNNNKRKKPQKKAEPKGPDAPGSPYIKPEPRSPSPLSAPHFVQPRKRLRSSTRNEQELVYDEPRIERPVSILHREPYAATHVQSERSPYGFERVDDPYARQVRQSVAPTSQRLERAIYEERRPDGTAVQYVQRVQSPYGYTAPFGAVESRALRAASYSVNPQYREVPTYQRDGRMSVRPYADRARSRSPVLVERRSPAMAPPAPPRVIVDQYGREYLEPTRTSAITRQPAIPAPRSNEREVIYERVPVRAPSRIAGDTFEEDGVIYRRASPAYAPRRVITQPEYGTDYRRYRERDYSMQPIGAPSQEFIPVGGIAGERGPNELSREYLSRAASVRPAEAVPYYHGLGAARPEAPPRQYAVSVHPEVRREAAPVIREFSVRPTEHDVTRREFSVRPVERFYDRPIAHAEEEVAYIERPRAAPQDIMYADNSRRQVYQ